MEFPSFLSDKIKDKNDLVKISDTIYGFSSHIEEQKKDSENKPKFLLIISGFSGAGKDAVVQSLIKKDGRFGWVKTCTTRARRDDEPEDDDPYIRLTEEEYQNAKDDVIEKNDYVGYSYCSLRSLIESEFEKHEIPILRIDPSGCSTYLKKWKAREGIFENIGLICVFITPPLVEDLEERLLKRSGDPEFVAKRMSRLKEDILYINDAEYIAINETSQLEKVVDDIIEILSS